MREAATIAADVRREIDGVVPGGWGLARFEAGREQSGVVEQGAIFDDQFIDVPPIAAGAWVLIVADQNAIDHFARERRAEGGAHLTPGIDRVVARAALIVRMHESTH